MCHVLNVNVLFFIILHVFIIHYPSTFGVNLSVNELAFFDTLNFPSLISLIDLDDNINFILSDTNTTVTQNVYMLVFIVEYGYCTYNEYEQSKSYFHINFLSNTNSTFSLKSYIPSDPCYHFLDPISSSDVAYQGYIIFENSMNNCPMESTVGDQNFKFTNETQIIYLQSSYSNKISRNKACHWRFSSPVGYTFKVVIEYFNVSSSTEFFIRNTTDTIVNQRSIQLSHSLYNDDNYIEVYLSKDSNTNINDIEFQAYVSIMKKFVETSDGECVISTDPDGTVSWSSYNFRLQGTLNNIYCNYTLTVWNNTEVYMIADISLEGDSDMVVYYPDENNNNGIRLYDDVLEIMLAPYKNGSEKHIYFEFKSDGSIQSLGFNIVFSILECSCNKEPIICGYLEYQIMDSNAEYYCGNLHCDYEDIFKIISDNKTVYETSPYVHLFSYFAFIFNSSSGNNNYLEFTSTLSNELKWLSLTALPFEVPMIDYTITLSSINASIIIDTDLINLVIVQIDDSFKSKNLPLKLYCGDPYGISLFNNESLTFLISQDYCFSNTHYYTCTLNYNKFAILPSVDPAPYPILVIQLPEKPKGCILNENVFLSKDSDTFSVVALANDNEPCNIIIVPSKFYLVSYLSYLWTTAIKENVQIFIGTDTTKLFFEFNAKTAKKFKNAVFLSRVYIVKIPQNSAVFFNFGKIPYDTTTISEHPFQSLLSTYYLNQEGWSEFKTILSYNFENQSVKFTVIDYIQSSDVKHFAFVVNNKTRIYAENITNYYVFNNQQVDFQCYFEELQDTLADTITFLIETID